MNSNMREIKKGCMVEFDQEMIAYGGDKKNDIVIPPHHAVLVLESNAYDAHRLVCATVLFNEQRGIIVITWQKRFNVISE